MQNQSKAISAGLARTSAGSFLWYDAVMDEEQQDKAMLRLAMAIEKAYHQPGFLIWRGFLIGLASGIGGVIGVAFIIALLGLMVSSLGGIPIIGEVLRDLLNAINR